MSEFIRSVSSKQFERRRRTAEVVVDILFVASPFIGAAGGWTVGGQNQTEARREAAAHVNDLENCSKSLDTAGLYERAIPAQEVPADVKRACEVPPLETGGVAGARFAAIDVVLQLPERHELSAQAAEAREESTDLHTAIRVGMTGVGAGIGLLGGLGVWLIYEEARSD